VDAAGAAASFAQMLQRQMDVQAPLFLT